MQTVNTDKKKRNHIDVLGHDCQFVRCPVGHRYSWGYADTVYVVKLDGVFIGTVREEPSNGWNFVGCSPSGKGFVLRGSSRVGAVKRYLEFLERCFSDLPEE